MKERAIVSDLLELEGTWEQILAYSDKLVGHRVRIIVLPENHQTSSPETPTPLNHSTAESLLKYAGTWEGDDFQEFSGSTPVN